jgi:hypothetical protein
MLHIDELCDLYALKDCRLIVEGKFACSIDEENYAGEA